MTGKGPEEPARGAHPSAGDLERFVRGELAREEVRLIVRHLLPGCAVCLKVTGRLWALGGDLNFKEGMTAMSEIGAAQEQLREIVRDLEAIRFRLLGVQETLPASAETARDLDVEQTDPGTVIRTVIQCVLNDSLKPAIGDLREVTEARTSEPAKGKG